MDEQAAAIARARVALPTDTSAARVARDVPYRGTPSGPLVMDLYRPATADREHARPAVVFVTGYSDTCVRTRLGCNAKDMAAYVSWGELTAASGMVATPTDPARSTCSTTATRRARSCAASFASCGSTCSVPD